MTVREGGCSRAPFDRFNLGDHVGDDPQAVAENRARLAAAMGMRPVFLRQVHGTDVLRIDADTPDGTAADAAVTASPHTACTVMVADCLPVLLCDIEGRVVAAAHAGWRGLAGEEGVGILERTVEAIRRLAAQRRASSGASTAVPALMAWLGPCIGPQAFEVGPEVRSAFCDWDPSATEAFRRATDGAADRWWADLAQLARRRLRAVGVAQIYGNDSSPAWCTVTQRDRYFSHRRDTARLGGTGRMAACIGLA
jgi:YfiH family protein